jgi:hypothetical protein
MCGLGHPKVIQTRHCPESIKLHPRDHALPGRILLGLRRQLRLDRVQPRHRIVPMRHQPLALEQAFKTLRIGDIRDLSFVVVRPGRHQRGRPGIPIRDLGPILGLVRVHPSLRRFG